MTGYTATLMQDGQTLEEFVLECANITEETPNHFEPSEFYNTQAKRGEEELARLYAMTEAEKIAFGEKSKEEAITNYQQHLKKAQEQNQRLTDMETQVLNWEVPNSDHEPLKKFMLQQLRDSRNSTKLMEYLLTKEDSPIDYYTRYVAALETHTLASKQSYKEEVVKAATETKRVQELRASLQPKNT